MSRLFNNDELNTLKSGLNSWKFDSDNKAMSRGLKFNNFSEAMGFIMQIAITADAIKHHPEWSNVYSSVWIKLTTHDAGGITELDENLAKTIDKIALKLGADSI